MRLCLLLLIALAACSAPPTTDTTPKPPPPPPDPAEPVATVDPATRLVRDLAGLAFERLGNPVLRWDHIPRVLAPKDRPHRLLVVLVEYQDRSFDRFAGDPGQAQKLAEWYREQLFDDTYERVDSLSHYYATQSLGAYHVTGHVLPPVKLSRKSSAYGTPHRPAGGDWRNDVDPEGLVTEALSLAKDKYPDLDWSEFDRWDPLDQDGDKNIDEPDGYLDHFVLVYPGGAQSSCQRLQRLDQLITPNVGMEALAKLDKKQRECANRIWPHRSVVKSNDGRGPTVAGKVNPLGGVPLSDSLWVRDYNIQSEYTGLSTFIHEFGHSIGLPDVYSRTSNNSTGSWEVMSGTTSPSPQNLSAWSRLMLGWLEPRIITPPAFGGQASTTVDLMAIDDPAGESEAVRAAMVVLPPKERRIELTALPASSGKWALYSGQGNELDRTATLSLDLRGKSGPIELSFDAWYEIEGGWDFAYVEVSADDGRSWTRRLPTDARLIPAKHGHDGKDSVPGFTGLSGDLDGDGKNESNPGCDPSKELAHGEDKIGAAENPCAVPTWVRPVFDLSDLAGKEARVRVRYYTDMAAVMRGLLIDNVRLTHGGADAGIDGDFEDDEHAGWLLSGFSRSSGRHDLLVPHYYLIEYRDPYAANPDGSHRYDQALAKPSYSFYYDPESEQMMAVDVRHRPGVVIWYYNGAFAWSENDPAINGPGKGYLLAVDSNPNEIPFPGLARWLAGSDQAMDSHYDLSSDEAQKALAEAYTRTVCFLRAAEYLPSTGTLEKLARSIKCGKGKKGKAPVNSLKSGDRSMRYVYEVINEVLPGPAYDAFQSVGELLDLKVRKGQRSYRLRDSALRALHTRDAAFSLDAFEDGVRVYRVAKDGLEQVESRPYPAQPSFSDKTPARWQNAKLPFGGVDVPGHGLHIDLQPVPDDAPAGTRARVRVSFEPAAR